MHFLTPPISPTTIPVGLTAARLCLCSYCPGCLNPPSRNAAAESLFALSDLCDYESVPLRSDTEDLRFACGLLGIAVHDQIMGTEGPRILYEARYFLKQVQRQYNQRIETIARIDAEMSRARRKWGKACEGLFGERKTRVVKSKARLRVRVPADKRKFVQAMVDRGTGFLSSSEYMALNKLEFP